MRKCSLMNRMRHLAPHTTKRQQREAYRNAHRRFVKSQLIVWSVGHREEPARDDRRRGGGHGGLRTSQVPGVGPGRARRSCHGGQVRRRARRSGGSWRPPAGVAGSGLFPGVRSEKDFRRCSPGSAGAFVACRERPATVVGGATDLRALLTVVVYVQDGGSWVEDVGLPAAVHHHRYDAALLASSSCRFACSGHEQTIVMQFDQFVRRALTNDTRGFA